MVFILHWNNSSLFVKAADTDKILLPETDNQVIVNEGFALSITRPEMVNTDSGFPAYVDYNSPLRECQYSISENNLKCRFYYSDENSQKFRITYEFKNKPTCELTSSTKIEKVSSYSYSSFEKKYNPSQYTAYYNFDNETRKITEFDLSTHHFEFLTNTNCTFTMNVARGKLAALKKKNIKQ
ncbi:hypothetical protein BCR32DRAFT_328396 [Anaeromyces robustus]|uniref:Uncharacterized protein n=1 Tax=Anaeromyces robustus TaxID=1754192 RepID=A0A1Y1WZE9_9FUNG|nr:hypothetical protein BCR32DRAFT_328396 [Anaeromyces robustus]|eukprot:ORX78812.1 hypothetical protein BCR32DRAFT_328396 [Anaeromyces robustus]